LKLNDINQLEQEFIALRQRFAQSLEILEDLSQIKEKFSTLSDTYQTLQGSIDQAKTLLETVPLEAVEPRLGQLETQVDIRHEQLQAQLTNLRFDFDATTRQLREEMEREHQKIGDFGDGSDPAFMSTEDANRLKWVESSLQQMVSSVYSDRDVLHKLDRRVANLKRTTDIMAVVGFVAFMLLGLMILVFK
jgi:DNA repair exonuclease SbcCD ATPase subunit